MKHKILYLLLVLLTASLPAKANDQFIVGGLTYECESIYSSNTVTLCGCQSFSGSTLIIPSNVTYVWTSFNVTYTRSFKVTAIRYPAFYGCTGLTSVTIPSSVTEIGNNAFQGCSGLTSVTIPNSVTKIPDGCFYECSGLTSVTIPSSVTEIGSSAFYGCSGLTSVTIPNSVTEIGSSAFRGCSGLTSVTIPNSVTSIVNSTFSGCTGLTSVTIPNSVTEIREGAFSGCTSLNRVNISDLAAWCNIDFGINYGFGVGDPVGSNPLSYAHNLYLNGTKVTDLIIPNTVTEIKGIAFYGCSSLTSVTIPNSATKISSFSYENAWGYYSYIGAFENCTGLTSVTISVTKIPVRCFYGCTGLTSVTIPSSVTEIGTNAFYGCTSLNRVNINDLAAWCNIDFGIGDSNPLSYAHNLYLNGTKITRLSIPNSVTVIKNRVFSGFKGVSSITIPNSVTSIGNFAFYDSFSGYLRKVISKIKEPQNVTYGGNGIFDEYEYGIKLYIPKGTMALYKATSPWNYFKTIIEIIDGDVNGDGNVTASDVTEVYNHLLNNAQTWGPFYDVNGDGVITAADITALYDILLSN